MTMSTGTTFDIVQHVVNIVMHGICQSNRYSFCLIDQVHSWWRILLYAFVKVNPKRAVIVIACFESSDKDSATCRGGVAVVWYQLDRYIFRTNVRIVWAHKNLITKKICHNLLQEVQALESSVAGPIFPVQQ